MWRMKREDFTKVVAEALDSLPKEFRHRIRNVAVLVEDLPPHEPPSEPGKPKRMLLGLVPRRADDPEERPSPVRRA